MKKWLQLSVTLLCSLTLCMTSYAASGQALDRIIVIVNDAVITQSDLDDAIDTMKRQLHNSNTPIPPPDALHKQVLDQLINRKLQLQLAEQAGIKVTDAEVTKTISTIAKNNKMTLPELYQRIASDGLSKAAYRKEIQEEIAIGRVQQQDIGARIMISPQEVDDFMKSAAWRSYNTKEYHLEDILVGLPDTPSSQQVVAAKQRAEQIVEKIHHGTSFKAVAAAESSGSEPLQGGDLGWRKLPEIPTAFADKLTRMKANEILGPIQTANGFHIVYIAGIRTAGMQGNAEAQRKQVQELLFQRKFEEALQSWLNKLRSEAFINMHPDNA